MLKIAVCLFTFAKVTTSPIVYENINVMLEKNPKEFIEQLINIARDAGAAIIKIYEESEDVVYSKKDDNSPLTAADSAANEIICEGLRKFEEQYPIISEENKQLPYEERKDFGRFWLVDPLDGTKEFIKRNGEFTVNIALVEKGRPIAGVVYAPILDEMYWAAKNEGAYLIKNDCECELKAMPFSSEDSNLGIICSRSHLNEATENFIGQYKSPELVSKGSSLKFLMIANAQAHIYPRIAPTMEWDTGAAQIIVEESGGKVVHFETGEPLSYNKENLLNPFFVAYAGIEEPVDAIKAS